MMKTEGSCKRAPKLVFLPPLGKINVRETFRGLFLMQHRYLPLSFPLLTVAFVIFSHDFCHFRGSQGERASHDLLSLWLHQVVSILFHIASLACTEHLWPWGKSWGRLRHCRLLHTFLTKILYVASWWSCVFRVLLKSKLCSCNLWQGLGEETCSRSLSEMPSLCRTWGTSWVFGWGKKWGCDNPRSLLIPHKGKWKGSVDEKSKVQFEAKGSTSKCSIPSIPML